MQMMSLGYGFRALCANLGLICKSLWGFLYECRALYVTLGFVYDLKDVYMTFELYM